jgi:spermidine synthase
MTLQVKRVLHHEKSPYQDVLVFESTNYGNVLVLDGVVQLTERDEFAYQESIAHLPLMSHPNPKKVLVIGGGDGGVLREVVKHTCVEQVILCEIDEAVIRVAKKYLPSLAVGFDHPKVKVHIGDGFKFLKEHPNSFDVIITDSSDPIGPAQALYERPFYELMYNALRPGGVISALAECIWLDVKFIKHVLDFTKSLFPSVAYAYASVPSYPTGQIGFILASKDPNRDLTKPLRKWTPEEERRLCHYYNSRIHEAAFIIPQFADLAIHHDAQ